MKVNFVKSFFALFLAILMGVGQVSVLAESDKSTISANEEALPVYVFQKAGNDNESFVILFLGDGYTEEEQDKFLSDISVRTKLLFQKEPFRSYADKINVYAVSTVSNETGVSSGSYLRDTYYQIIHYDSATYIRTDVGVTRAKNIRSAMESRYLDKGATVDTIHILSNSDDYFGSSQSTLFSFSSRNAMYAGGETTVHELSHSIGKLKDEYGAVRDGSNATTVNDLNEVPWKQLLGFRGVGFTTNGNSITSFIPSLSCIMKSLDNREFCEVCKLELARRLNSTMYTTKPSDYYMAEPDVTIEHSDTSAIGEAYDKCRINDSNIAAANGHTLELRTIIQNLTDYERHFKMSFQITDSKGNVKFSKEENFTVAPLLNEFNPEAARESLSVKIENVSGLSYGDKIWGTVLDLESQTVAATFYPSERPMCTVTINHKIMSTNGSVTTMPNTYATTVYVPNNSEYLPKIVEELNGYRYVGNSLEGQSVIALKDTLEIDFYYRKDSGKQETKTEILKDKKTFAIMPNNITGGSTVVLALYNNGILVDVQSFLYNGEELYHQTKQNYNDAKVMVWKDFYTIEPICELETVVK